MEKLNKFIKENYKLLIPVLLMILIFVVFFIYYQISTRDVLEETTLEFYQYFSTDKTEYEGVVTTNKKGEVVEFKSNNKSVKFDSTPIYYKDLKTKVLLPKDMSVVMPTLSCAEYLSKGISIVEYKDGMYNLTTKKYNNKLNYYFFYDSKDLYFFIENVTLKFNDKEVKLSPFSYVIYRNTNDTLEYYDKGNDKYEVISDVNGDVTVSSEYYDVVVSRDFIDYYGSEVLLTSSIDKLMTIDNKD